MNAHISIPIISYHYQPTGQFPTDASSFGWPIGWNFAQEIKKYSLLFISTIVIKKYF